MRPEAYTKHRSYNISRGNKFYIMVLSHLGLLPISEIEKDLADGLLQCDLYLGGEYDMIIDVHGPAHYLYGTEELIDSSLYVSRIYKKYHKNYVVMPYEMYNKYYYEETVENLKDITDYFKKYIESHLQK